jgi:NAD(P)-dependent dehydrogenase (short-subunit alcohol dehydrogenase family)
VRWERLYEKVEAGMDIHPPILKQRGVYVITGGLGAVGYTFAEYLLKNYEATVCLLGRTSLPETSEWTAVLQNERTNEHTRSRILKMQELSRSGGQVIYRQCDTTDEASLAKTLNEMEAAFGNINGIIHAAGKLPESLPKITTELTRHDFESYLEAKVKGLEILKHVTDKREPDFVLVTSSVATVLGGIGFGGYAPANNFINYFINSQRLTGKCERWLSINLDALDLQHSYSDGAIGKEELNEVLERAMGMLSVSQVLVSAGDLNGRRSKQYG